MIKISQNLSLPFIRELFTKNEVVYNTRSNISINVDDDHKTNYTRKLNFKVVPIEKTTNFGHDTIKRMGSRIQSNPLDCSCNKKFDNKNKNMKV